MSYHWQYVQYLHFTPSFPESHIFQADRTKSRILGALLADVWNYSHELKQANNLSRRFWKFVNP
jgi:hypothetical protein